MSGQLGVETDIRSNHLDRLDPALCRPGRFDVRIPFFGAVPEQATALFLHFYPLDDFLNTDAPDTSDGEKSAHTITSRADLDALATQFSSAVFDTVAKGESVSMASLQGYLLSFKEDPAGAADGAGKWASEVSPKKALSAAPKGI